MTLFQQMKNKKLLLVDDDEWIRSALTLFFETEGLHIMACETAEEALALVDRQAFDIFIVDLRLPDMDGLSFLKRIYPASPHALKIMISAFGSDAAADEGKKYGVYAFLKKPLDSRAIQAVLLRGLAELQARP